MPSLMAVLGLDAKGFKGGLDAAQLHAQRAGRSITTALGGVGGGLGFGGLGAAALGAAAGTLVKRTMDWAGSLQDVSDGLGVTVEWLQKMQNGAITAGGSLEDIEKTLLNIQKARESALRDPKGSDAGALSRLGFSRQDIASLPAQQFFDRLVAKFKDGADAQAVNDVVEVGGKSAKSLLAAFRNGFESEIPVVSAQTIAALDILGDRFTSFSRTLLADVAPAIVAAMDEIIHSKNRLGEAGAFLGSLAGSTGPETQSKVGYARSALNAQLEAFNERIDERIAGGSMSAAEGEKRKAQAARIAKVYDGLADSIEAASQTYTDEAEYNAAKEAERQKLLNQIEDAQKAFANAAPFDLSKFGGTLSPSKNSGRNDSLKLNALQQVGGYAAVPPGQLQMYKNVESITKNVERIALKPEQLMQVAALGTTF